MLIIGSCTDEDTVVCLTVYFKPSIHLLNPVGKKIDIWTLKSIPYCILKWWSCALNSVSTWCLKNHPANGCSHLLAIVQVTFHQHYCQAGNYTFSQLMITLCTRNRTLQKAVRMLDTWSLSIIKRVEK